MGSLGNPQTWPPYDNIRDCSQGFCSFYCPQWCYIIFPPPPPFYPDDDNSGTSFSPLVIAIIGILASAFLLVTYYTVISKYCGNFDSLRRRGETTDQTEETDENQNPAGNETWQGPSTGLDEALIKKITVCKYKKDDGFVEGSDCSVCLSEFVEDESLRLLPKCSHAFHLSCIDTWLKSHSNCPLCRANVIVLTTPPPLQLPPPVLHQLPDASEPENNNNNDVVLAMEDFEEEVPPQNDSTPKTPEMSEEEGDTIIEIREQRIQQIRRSVSMDALSDVSGNERVSIADVLCMSDDEGSSLGHPLGIGSSSSKRGSVDERNKFNNRSKALHCVASPVAMKRSFSSGRFLFTRQGRGKNVVIPM